jgi:hypothetical protein
VFVDQPDLKVARMDVSEERDEIGVLNFHFLVASPSGVDYFTELHEVGLFTVDQYLDAFGSAGLEVTHDRDGPMGRGLYAGVKVRTPGE